MSVLYILILVVSCTTSENEGREIKISDKNIYTWMVRDQNGNDSIFFVGGCRVFFVYIDVDSMKVVYSDKYRLAGKNPTQIETLEICPKESESKLDTVFLNYSKKKLTSHIPILQKTNVDSINLAYSDTINMYTCSRLELSEIDFHTARIISNAPEFELTTLNEVTCDSSSLLEPTMPYDSISSYMLKWDNSMFLDKGCVSRKIDLYWSGSSCGDTTLMSASWLVRNSLIFGPDIYSYIGLYIDRHIDDLPDSSIQIIKVELKNGVGNLDTVAIKIRTLSERF